MFLELFEPHSRSFFVLFGVVQVYKIWVSVLLHDLVKRVVVDLLRSENVVCVPGLLPEDDRSPLSLKPLPFEFILHLSLFKHLLGQVLSKLLRNLLRHQPVVPGNFLAAAG